MGISKKKKRKKVRKVQEDLAAKMIRKSYPLTKNPRIKVVKGKEKMSGVLIDFAEPLFKYTDNENKVFTLAMIGWNAGMLPAEERGKLIHKLSETEGAENHPQFEVDLKAIIDILIERKKKLYPDNKRMILGYEFTGYGDNKTLNVLSTVHSKA